MRTPVGRGLAPAAFAAYMKVNAGRTRAGCAQRSMNSPFAVPGRPLRIPFEYEKPPDHEYGRVVLNEMYIAQEVSCLLPPIIDNFSGLFLADEFSGGIKGVSEHITGSTDCKGTGER